MGEGEEDRGQKWFWGQVELAISIKNQIIQGDMNYINLGETDFIYENNNRDIWLDFKQLDEGFTWDAKTNSYIKLLFLFPNRRLRVDRIIVKKGAQDIRFKGIEIFGQESIGISRFGKDYIGSDHYGLVSIMTLDPEYKEEVEEFDYLARRDEILKGRDPRSSGYAYMSLY